MVLYWYIVILYCIEDMYMVRYYSFLSLNILCYSKIYQTVIQIWVVIHKHPIPQVLILSFHRSLNVSFCHRNTVMCKRMWFKMLVIFVLWITSPVHSYWWLYFSCSCVVKMIFFILFSYGIHSTDKGRISNSTELSHTHTPFIQHRITCCTDFVSL